MPASARRVPLADHRDPTRPAEPRILATDRAYCRAVLPRVSRTFAVNIQLLNGSMGEAVRVGYLLCRAADALEDSWPGDPREIGRRFELFQGAVAGDEKAGRELASGAAALGGKRDDLALVANLPRVLAVVATLPPDDRAAILDAVRIMARGMSRYAVRAAERSRAVSVAGRGAPGGPSEADRAGSVPVAYLDNEGELHDYCWVVAGCVGVMLTRLFSSRSPAKSTAVEARRFELAPVVGEALQLTNVLLDWPIDIRRGRCHIPGEWLHPFGLAPRELVGVERPGIAEIAARLESLARSALSRVPDYLETIPVRHVRYRLFCLWPALWALASLRHARRDPDFPWGPRRPRLPRGELWRSMLGSLFAAHDPRSLRGFCVASG